MESKKIIGILLVVVGVILLSTSGLPFMSVVPIDTRVKFSLSEFSPNAEISGKGFVAGRPVFLCESDQKKLMAGQPRSDCWEVTLSFNENSYNIKDGEGTNLNEFMHVDYKMEGFIRTDGNAEYWANVFTLKMINPFLQSSFDNRMIELSAPHKVDVKVNNLWEDVNGGLYVEYRTTLIAEEGHFFVDNLVFKKGSNTYAVMLDKTPLGVTSIRVTPYFIIKIGNEEVKILSTPSSGSIYVTPKLGDIDTSVDCSRKQCPTGFECRDYGTAKICEKEIIGEIPFSDTNDYLDNDDLTQDSNWVSIVAVLLLVGGVILVAT